jgi:hypothetical protein
MRVNEFRVGNIVKIKGYVCEIVAISNILPDNIMGLTTNEHGNKEHFQDSSDKIDDVILTTELAAEILDLDLNNKIYLRYNKLSGMWVVFNHHKIKKLNSIPSVHQLQNLYFALTGQELEFKL